MATEIELKLQLSPRTARKLAAHPLLAGLGSPRQRLLNTYFDTPELDLLARKIAVRFRKKGWQWLLTVKSAEPACGGLAMRSEWETPATPGHFDFSHVDNPELRAFLEQASGRLEAIFTTDFRRQTWQLAFGESLIELAVDRGRIASRDQSTPICEVELELLSGRVDDLFGLTRALQEKLDLHPAIASKAERGYRLYFNQPAQPFKAKPVALDAAMTPLAAFRSIALACLEHFQRNEAGLPEGGDPEFVHQARVALRRLRSAIKLFSPVLPEDFVAAYGDTWRTLANALGDARNWDVFLEETLPPIQAAFPDHGDVRRLRNEARRRARSARRAIGRLLAVREYPRLMLEFTAAIYALTDNPDGSSLKDFAGERLARHARRARRLAEAYPTASPEERHALRIAFKKLRYTLEFFSPLLARRQLAPYLAALSRLQDELGRINDHLTAEGLLKEAIARRPNGPVHGWIAGRHQLLVGELDESLTAWLAQPMPRW